jgi:hypothetical protein
MIKPILAILCGTALLIGSLPAQTSGVATTTTGAESIGTITEYTPGTALVLDTASGEPVQFKLSKNITYTDSDGKVIEAAGLRKNLKVRVHYIKVGGDNVADKVSLTGN